MTSSFQPSQRALCLALILALNACGGGSSSETSSAESAESTPPNVNQGLAAKVAAAQEPIAPASAGQWSPLIELSTIPVAATNLPNGKILMWSASSRFDFGPGGLTYTTQLDPVTGAVTEERVDQTGHDMFCPGTANLPDGSILVSGGVDSGKTSNFNAATGQWTTGATMSIPRAYHATTVLSDGSVFALGGSWAGGIGNKHGEIWSPGTGWRNLPGVLVDPALATDLNGGAYRSDNHMWLLTAPNGKVLQAGPSPAMNWIDPRGSGRITPAGLRGDDQVALNGNVAMYDIGKVLKVGGSIQYDGAPASSAAYVIDANVGVSVRKIAPMAYPRVYSTAVVLPNGEVMITGGQSAGRAFSDDFSVLPPELWNPVTERFTTLSPVAVGRNYHSVSLLLPDGRVMTGGSGLCGDGCAANHPDVQIYTPHYLLNENGSLATRPVIESAPSEAVHGTTINVRTDLPVTSFALMRLSSTTHTVNNDQRRVPLQFIARGAGNYDLAIPSNPGVVLPGYYMLFALDDRGVPSVSTSIRITGTGAPVLGLLDNPTSAVGTFARQSVTATSSSPVQYAATGLPPGLSINRDSGLISGTPTTAGQYAVSISATNSLATTSTQTLWSVESGGSAEVSYVRLRALSDVTNSAWASIAEFNLLDGNGNVMSRAGWTASASSEEPWDNRVASSAIDGNPATIWQSPFVNSSPSHPHSYVVNLGGPRVVTGFVYTPRSDMDVGVLARWAFDTSRDGVNWTSLAQGDLRDFVTVKGDKTVYFNNLARSKPSTQSSTAGGAASLAVDGNVNGNLSSGTVSQTNAQPESWWQVDLGSAQPLSAVRLWHRTDCCLDRTVNLVVLTSATNNMAGRSLAQLLDSPDVTHTAVSIQGARQTTLRIPATARYVRVQVQGTDPLELAEVEVFGASGNHAPVFAPLAPPTSVAGESLSLSFTATDTDGDAVTFSAVGLPPGLSINTQSGLVSGRPTTTGTFNAAVSATDSQAARTTLNVVWTVVPAPVLDVPMPNPPALAGGAVTLYSGTAPPAGVTYQWSFGDGTNGVSTLPDIQHVYSAPGVYAVQVTLVVSGQVVDTRSFNKAIYAPPTASRPTQSTSVRWEARSGTSGRIWMVNPDNDSVSVFDDATQVRLAEVPTGVSPRSVAVAPNGRIWVVNSGQATISMIDPTSLQVVQTLNLPRASRPHGLAFAPNGAAAYVALEATGQLLQLNPVTGATTATLSVGPNPRHLAVSADSARVLVSRFVTPPLPGEGTSTVLPQDRGAEVLVVSASPGAMAINKTVVLRHSDKPDSSTQGRGVPNYLGAPAISPDGRGAWVPSKQDNILRGSLRDGTALNFQSTVRAISSRIDLASLAEDYAARVDHDNAGLASAGVFHPTGAYLFVALQTSRQFVVLDPVRRVELLRIETGLAPDGLAVSNDGMRLYVNNFMGRRLATYDLSRLVNQGETSVPLVASTVSVVQEKLDPTVLAGKQLFYDARDTRLARDAYLSCASCHQDGGQDGRTWDLTGFGEGLRNTVALRGRGAGHGPMHWSANFDEVQDFEAQIRNLAGGTGLMSDTAFNTGTRRQPLGDRKTGVSSDLDALAAYVTSLTEFDASPFRAPDGSLTAQAVAGRGVFAARCSSCHAGRATTDSAFDKLRDVGTLKPSSGKRLGATLTGIDTPTLRDVWATGPYLHDGSAPSLEAAIAAHRGMNLSVDDTAAVVAYTRQIGSEQISARAASGTGLSGTYFNSANLQGAPVHASTEAINFAWAYGSPAAAVTVDNFTVRWTGTIEAPSTGQYSLRTLSDDGVRVWIDGQLLIDDWRPHGVIANTTRVLNWEAGKRYAVTVEYQELGGQAEMRFQWQTPGSSTFVPVPAERLYAMGGGSGLSGDYFANPNLQGRPVQTRTEAVSFVWGAAPAGVPGLPADGFSVRWSGMIEAPVYGDYVLRTLSDDGVRVWIDGQLVIDNWTGHAPLYDTTAPLRWTPGERHVIRMEYNETAGSGAAQLEWRLPGESGFQVVPKGYLHPSTGTGLKGYYFTNPNMQGVAVLDRVDTLYFQWAGSPAPNVPADGFSIRWSGSIEAQAAGSYMLRTLSDDGVRVWLDGALVIDNWTGHAPTIDTSAAITFAAGERRTFYVDYQETGGPGTLQLLWRTPGSSEFVPVPTNRLYPTLAP